MSVRSPRATRLRRAGSAAAIVLTGVVLPLAAACDSDGDSGDATNALEPTVATPSESTTVAPPPPTTTAAPTEETLPEVTTPEGAGPSFIYFARASDGALVPTANLASGVTEVVEAVAAGPDDPELVGGLPPGTTIESVSVDGTTATVELSEDFVIGYQTGSAAETVAVAPLVYSVTELPEVDSVLITVDGGVPMPVGASFDFANPLTRADVPATFAEGFG